MTSEGKLTFRPKQDTVITLTATIKRGSASDVKNKVGVAGPVVVTGSVGASVPGTYQLHHNEKDLAGNTAAGCVLK